MTEEGKKYLSDILLAIGLVEEFTFNLTDFNAYITDLKTHSAIERQLIIIGVALNKFFKEEPKQSCINGHQIISFRNRLVHAYDGIDNAIVWSILKRHLPNLKKEIESL